MTTSLPRVLVAEDDPLLRELIVGALTKDGFHVSQTQNGLGLVDRVSRAFGHHDGPAPQNEGWDLIISDVRMAGMTGLDALSYIRSRGWKTPFILITGLADERLHQEADALDAVCVIDKPFDLDDLCLWAHLALD